MAKKGIILVIVGVILIIVGVLLFFIIRRRVKEGVKKAVRLDQEDEDKWSGADETDAVPLWRYFYFFNVTNAADARKGTAKPKLQEVGPYVYRLRNRKFDIKWSDSKPEVSFKTYPYYEFNPEQSKGNPTTDQITMINPGYVGAVHKAGSEILLSTSIGSQIITSALDGAVRTTLGIPSPTLRQRSQAWANPTATPILTQNLPAAFGLSQLLPSMPLNYGTWAAGQSTTVTIDPDLADRLYKLLLEPNGALRLLTSINAVIKASGGNIPNALPMYTTVVKALLDIDPTAPNFLDLAPVPFGKGIAQVIGAWVVFVGGASLRHQTMVSHTMDGLFVTRTPDSALFKAVDRFLARASPADAVVAVFPNASDDAASKRVVSSKPDNKTVWITDTGANNIEDIDLVKQADGYATLPWWGSGYSLAASKGRLYKYAPFFKIDNTPDERLLFTTTVWRTVKFQKTTEEPEIEGLKTNLYHLNEKQFAPNPQFHNPFIGMVNLTGANDGLPVWISAPHFFRGDSAVQSEVEGLTPTEKNHRTKIWVEPYTGATLSGHSRLQSNLRVEWSRYPVSAPTASANNSVVVPWFWIDETATITEDLAKRLKRGVYGLRILALIIMILLIVIGLVLIGIGIFLHLKKKKSETSPVPVTSTEQMQIMPNADPASAKTSDQA